MIRAVQSGEKNGKPIINIVIGLSRANLDRLQKGKPLAISETDPDIPNILDILFFLEEKRTPAP